MGISLGKVVFVTMSPVETLFNILNWREHIKSNQGWIQDMTVRDFYCNFRFVSWCPVCSLTAAFRMFCSYLRRKAKW